MLAPLREKNVFRSVRCIRLSRQTTEGTPATEQLVFQLASCWQQIRASHWREAYPTHMTSVLIWIGLLQNSRRDFVNSINI